MFQRTKQTGLAVGVLLLGVMCAANAQEESKLKPTEVLYYSLKAMAENPGANRLETVSEFYKRLDETELDDVEEFARAEVAFVNLLPGEAQYYYEPYMSESGMRARIAWQKVMQIQFRGYRRPDITEEMIADYHKKFAPDPADIWDTSFQIANFANTYLSEGEHEKVVDIVLKEVARMPRNAPYRAFALPVQFIGSFAAIGRLDEAMALIRDIRREMQQQLLTITSGQPNGAVVYAPVPLKTGRYLRMEEGLDGGAFDNDYPSQTLRVRQYMRLISELRLHR